MNSGQIIRSKSTDNFTILPNELVKSEDLSLEEKGLLSFLLSLPSDWVLYKTQLTKHLPDSKGTIDRVFKSLQEKGYILSVKVIDNGHFKGWNHIVYDSRHQHLPTSAFADIGKSSPIQRTEFLQSTNSIQSTEVLPFFEEISNNAWMDWIRYRKEIGKKLSLTTKNAQIKFLKQFSDQEIAEIINNSIKNGWQGLFDLKKKKNGIDYDSELQSILGS